MAKKNADSTNQTKKEIKKELAGKIEKALPEIKVRLGEKKFHKRIKKATNMLMQGLHLKHPEKDKNFSATNGQTKTKETPKKKAVKKNETN